MKPTKQLKRIALFWSLVDKRIHSDECWLWMGPLDTNGYGRFWYMGKTWRAHRLAYALAIGSPIPDELLGRHRCDTRPCCRPSHIEPGTQLDNACDIFKRSDFPLSRWKPTGMRGKSLRLLKKAIRMELKLMK